MNLLISSPILASLQRKSLQSRGGPPHSLEDKLLLDLLISHLFRQDMWTLLVIIIQLLREMKIKLRWFQKRQEYYFEIDGRKNLPWVTQLHFAVTSTFWISNGTQKEYSHARNFFVSFAQFCILFEPLKHPPTSFSSLLPTRVHCEIPWINGLGNPFRTLHIHNSTSECPFHVEVCTDNKYFAYRPNFEVFGACLEV